MSDISPLEAYEAAQHTLTTLRECDTARRRRRRQWEERLDALWGEEPPYTPQAEDASSWFFGRFFYTWIGDTMYRASQEELTADQLPGPMRCFRACNIGRELSREVQRQRSDRRLWDAFLGARVSLKVGRGFLSCCRGQPSHEAGERIGSPAGGYGTLRYVGPVRQISKDSGEIFAGIAWHTAPRHHRAPREGEWENKPGLLLTDGEVAGEGLFELQDGEAVASVERVKDLLFPLVDPAVYYEMDREGRRLCRQVTEEVPATIRSGAVPASFGIGRGVVRSLGYYILPAVPFCILKNALTLVSPMVLEAYISYIEAVTGAGTAKNNSTGFTSSSSSSSFSYRSSSSFSSSTSEASMGFGVGLAASVASTTSSFFSSMLSSSSSSVGGMSSSSFDSSSAAEPPTSGSSSPSSIGYGLFLTLLLFLVPLCESIASNRFSILCYRASYTTKHALIALLFEKCLTISGKSLSDPSMSAGRLVNLMSSDVGRIASFAQMFWSMLSAPVTLTVSIFLLYRLVGWAAFVGAGVLVLFMPLQGIIMVFMFKTFRAKAKATDARLKATNEFISGIRVAKFMSWEPSFVMSIEDKRNEELRQLRNIQYSYMIVSFFMNAAPSLVVASVFFTYSATGHTLTPSVVFPVISLLWILEMPFFMIPMTIQMVLRCTVSARRLNRFLECDDTDPDKIKDTMKHYHHTGSGVSHRDTGSSTSAHEGHASFQTASRMNSTLEDRQLEEECWHQATAVWFRRANLTAYSPVPLVDPRTASTRASTSPSDPTTAASTTGTAPPEGGSTEASASTAATGPKPDSDDDGFYNLRPKVLLENVNLRIPRGKLTVILGPTGSGKSTLLDSLIGAVDVTSGRVLAARSVAYVPQQAWIMNATLRDNVLFFSDLDEARFERALDCSQLRADLSLLADGLETEIGEKGINLSGGQKARVGLARAVYADKELYLLDDPLSALDAHVGERVMRECVLGELSGKTRVLATHQTHVVDQADLVVLIENGQIAFTGTPEEFHAKGLTVDAREAASSRRGSTAQHESDPSQEGIADDPQGPEEDGEEPVSSPVDDVDSLAKRTSLAGNSTGNAGGEGTEHSTDASGADGAGAPSEHVSHASGDEVAAPERNQQAGRLLTEEEMATGAVSFEAYGRYIQACGGWCMACAILILYLSTEFIVAGPYLWLSFWSTDVFGLSTNQYLAVYGLLTLVGVLCSPARYLSTTGAGRRAGRALHSRLLRSVACGTLQFFDTTPTGRIINRFSKDMEQLDDDLPGDIAYLMSSVGSAVSVIVILATSQYLILFLLLPLTFVYVRLMRFYNAANRHLQRITNVSHSSVFSILGETLSGRWTIEAYHKGNAVMAKALRSLDRIYASGFMVTVGNKWLSVRIESMTAVVTAAVAGLGVLACHMPWLLGSRVGMLSLSLLMARRLSWVLNSMIMQTASVEADMNAVERVSAYIDAIQMEEGVLQGLEKEIDSQRQKEKEGGHRHQRALPQLTSHRTRGDAAGEQDPLLAQHPDEEEGEEGVPVEVTGDSLSGAVLSPSGDEDAVTRPSVPAGSLEFRHVDMRYRPGLPLVLRDVSFCIAPGQKVGVVGRTGSGKSTLLLAFLRLVEVCGGEMVVCGRSARTYDVRSLRQLFSMIPQDPLLFDGTVRSNIDPFGAASDAECWAALGHVGMAVRVRSEAGGLDGRVAEGGSNFSVGQRQLLCLARALLKRGSAFLLMDEATANVDPALDGQIQETVARTFRAYTVITIAHRLHTVAGYDMILMMDGGRVVACGSPRALVSDASSPFAVLVRSMGAEAQRKFMEAMK